MNERYTAANTTLCPQVGCSAELIAFSCGCDPRTGQPTASCECEAGHKTTGIHPSDLRPRVALHLEKPPE